MRFSFVVSVLLQSLAATASPLALDKRANKIDPFSGLATVQWTSNNGAVNNIRNYHIAKDGKIIESVYSNNVWVSSPIGLTGASDGTMVAGVHKRSESQMDVEIRLFYQSGSNMKSAKYTSSGWAEDTRFIQDMAQQQSAEPSSVVTWVDANKVVQWRLYFVAYGESAPAQSMRNSIYEAVFPAGASSDRWDLGNGGQELRQVAAYPGQRTAVAAVAWKGGARISVFFWDLDGSPLRPGEIREYRWIAGTGWALQDMPNDDFESFSTRGGLSAVAWVDAAGTDQLRLYVRWADPASWNKPRLVEFQAGSSGWSKQSKDFPSYTVDGTAGVVPLAAAAWTYPTAGNVNIRLHYPTCSTDWDGYGTCDAVIREAVFTTGDGWGEGKYIDG